MLNYFLYPVTEQEIVQEKPGNWVTKVLQLKYQHGFKEVRKPFCQWIKENYAVLLNLPEDELRKRIYQRVELYQREYPEFFPEDLGYWSKEIYYSYHEDYRDNLPFFSVEGLSFEEEFKAFRQEQANRYFTKLSDMDLAKLALVEEDFEKYKQGVVSVQIGMEFTPITFQCYLRKIFPKSKSLKAGLKQLEEFCKVEHIKKKYVVTEVYKDKKIYLANILNSKQFGSYDKIKYNLPFYQPEVEEFPLLEATKNLSKIKLPKVI